MSDGLIDVDLGSDRYVMVQPRDVRVGEPHAPVRHGVADRRFVGRAVNADAASDRQAKLAELARHLAMLVADGRHE